MIKQKSKISNLDNPSYHKNKNLFKISTLFTILFKLKQ